MNFRKERKGLVFIGLICVILFALITLIVLSLKQDTIEENLKSDPVIKTLFVIEDKNQVLFTNIFIYYPVSGKGLLVNIPGSTGGLHSTLDRVDRIDAVYTELGIDTYLKQISSFVDIEVPFYITTTLDNFVALTDLLGGLELFIPLPIDTTSSTGEAWLLPNGRVKLDGDKVKTYMTYFFEDETEEQILQRRQDATVAFLSSIKANANTFLNETNFKEVSSKIKTNVKENDLLKLFLYISQVDTERFEYISVTGNYNTIDGKKLLMPFRNGEYIKDVVRKGINSIVSPSGTANARPYVMRILNGTKTQGLAHNTRILLEGAAFDVLDIGNVDQEEEVEETYIIDHIGRLDAAKNIGEFIHCTKVIEEEIKEGDEENVSNVDFTLVLGRDFDGRWVNRKK